MFLDSIDICQSTSKFQFISIMIGSNDFCSDMCWVPSPWSILEKHKEMMLQVLRTLRDNLPRTFVALIPPPHLKVLVDIREDDTSLFAYVTGNLLCGCMFGMAFRENRPLYYEIIKR